MDFLRRPKDVIRGFRKGIVLIGDNENYFKYRRIGEIEKFRAEILFNTQVQSNVLEIITTSKFPFAVDYTIILDDRKYSILALSDEFPSTETNDFGVTITTPIKHLYLSRLGD